MMPMLADHNFNDAIVEGLQIAAPEIDIIRAIEVGLEAATDDVLLGWAASRQRIILTHDRRSMIQAINARVAKAQPVDGVIIVRTNIRIGLAVEGILIIAECGAPTDWARRYIFVPF